MKESVITSFDKEWDVMPSGRVKFIHPVGGVCKFTLDIKNSPYTGILKRGTQTGIIRLTTTTDVSNGVGITPGAAIKFLRTGRSSANMFAVDSLDKIPNKNYNFFAVPLRNHIRSTPPPKTILQKSAMALVEKKFKQASKCPTKIALSDMARSVK